MIEASMRPKQWVASDAGSGTKAMALSTKTGFAHWREWGSYFHASMLRGKKASLGGLKSTL